ncbi:PucR family transcriptional regulator [Amycolatopsis suaedae]|uniref:PucR family transcriptional regulator n=1 Tax=Amycolatopsis suaedae TaxID=2510978 RepID=A0A4Q7J9P6_9PSEU|nr:PucR family transcriptional regulator [Amycolatopsis suaedae]RZQ63947.1 PucR family transcriptional regulator [Amycolatopsis suaedae]
MRLATLLDTPELGLTLLVGTADARDREFDRVFTATLADPTRYLLGGEVVLVGMRWLPGPGDAGPFVAALVEAGVVALGAGTAEVDGPVPEYMIDACRRAGLPLFEVPVSVSFATVTERVIPELAAERAGPDGHKRLVAAVTGGGGLAALLAAGGEELGAACWVLSATGHVVAGTAQPPDAGVRASLAGRFLLAGRLPLVTSVAGEPVTVLAASSRAAHRVASWLLVVEGDHARSELAAEFASLVGLERSRLDDARRFADRAAAPLLRLVLSGEARQAEVTSALVAAGFSADDRLLAVSAGVRGGGPGLAPVLAGELLAPAGPAVVGTVDGEVFALVHATDALAERVREAVRVVEPALGSARLAVGISQPSDAQGLRAAVQESRHARTLAELAPGRANVVAGSEVASHLLLLAAVPDELRRSFGARVLGPLRDYDNAHRSDLEQTLKAFLEHSGSWTQTAAALHLHVNTLRYRINRISELTGRDPGRFADRVDLYLAACFAPST